MSEIHINGAERVPPITYNRGLHSLPEKTSYNPREGEEGAVDKPVRPSTVARTGPAMTRKPA